MKRIQLALLSAFFLNFLNACSIDISYPEYKLSPVPSNINAIYLQDSLRYLSLAASEEAIIEETFAENSQIEHKLMTFPREKIRVLTIYDPLKNTQIVNIISLHNGEDLIKALRSDFVQGKLFRFPINGFYNYVYSNIRTDIISAIKPNAILQINGIGSTTAYSALLAIELTQLQSPVESILNFGSTRFTSGDAHGYIAKKFDGIMVNVTHENDINHKIYMGHYTAALLPQEYIICKTHKCYEAMYEQKIFSKREIRNNVSSFPRQYVDMYHDSLIRKNI